MDNKKNENLKFLAYDCLSVIRMLITLKSHKEKFGKTPWYLNQQPITWEHARELLKRKVR